MRFIYRSHVRQAIVLFGLLVFAPACFGQFNPPFAVALVDACVSRTFISSTDVKCDDANAQFNPSGPASLTGTIGAQLGAPLTASLFAETGFGTMRSSASASFNISGSPAVAFAFADAIFGDIITVNSPPFNGQPGLLIVTYQLSGSISKQGRAGASTDVDISVSNPDSSNFQDYSTIYTSSVSGVFIVPQIFHVTYGQPYVQQFLLQTRTGTMSPTQFLPTIGQGSGTVDFSNTLVLVGLEFQDANGNPLPSPPSITSASGTNYSENGILSSFSDFSADVNVNPNKGKFETEGSFILASTSDGIDPLSEDVSLQIGSFSATIPPGSFVQNQNEFKFEGVINGSALKASIRLLPDGRYRYAASGDGASAAVSPKPSTVRLIIGNDGGKSTKRPNVGAAIHVPEDFSTIQSAIDAANDGDTIFVREGRWCGATITKKLNLIGGEGTTIIACPNNFGPANLKRGFLVRTAASGSAIRNFTFDGSGFSDTNSTPLALGIGSNLQANNIFVEHNRFVGGLFGVNVNGTGWTVSNNDFDGFTILSPPNCTGGAAIASANVGPTRFTNTFTHNRITAAVPDGNLGVCSWINEVDVPLAGIVASGQDGTTISDNQISIAANSSLDAGAGIIASDRILQSILLTDINMLIVNNDARQSEFGVIVTSGNTQGAVIRDNDGINLIDGITTNATDHSMPECDESSGCR